MVGTGTDHCTIQSAQIKVARASPAKHKTELALIPHRIKKTKVMNIFGGCIALSLPAFSYCRFVPLPVIAPHALEQIPPLAGIGFLTLKTGRDNIVHTICTITGLLQRLKRVYHTFHRAQWTPMRLVDAS